MIELDRGDFLRLGAGGLAAVAEPTSRDFYRAAYKQADTGLEPTTRRPEC